MLKKERENEIINILRESDGFATVKALCEKMYVSESSIRRDLTSLEKNGVVKRIYGGAELLNIFSGAIDFRVRAVHNSFEKQCIAKKAVKIIKDGDVIFLDQSSSAFYLACEIVNKNRVTVVTNNIEIIGLLSDSHIDIISSGGILSRENRTCLVGKGAEATFEGIFADKLFFSTKSISQNGEISDCSMEEVFVRNAMLKNAREKIFLCDSEKIDTIASYRQCALSEINYLICEKDIDCFKNYNNLKIL